MTTPSPDQIKTLEQSRQRLIQLTHSLGSLITSLNQSDPLPSWPSLQTQASIISNNLQSISTHLSENHELLRSISALPAPEFPTKTHGNTLEQLLRTKLDPRVEDWVSRGRKADNAAAQNAASSSGSAGMFSTLPSATAGGLGAGVTGAGAGGLSEGDLAALWEWAPVEANAEARKRSWGGNFTLEERERGIESVVAELGLRRVLEDDEESEEEEEEDMDLDFGGKAEGAGDNAGAAAGEQVSPVVPMNDILRYMTTGILPAVR
ncbi:RNA polymerase II mediator complex subunit MED8 [Aspergillus mulundensis]|uniref:Mediator of RNA polymerase II transcription subunit 8 n=1 Tax=Aspergillus mulundensis TaxID=1810919 RepID=A0A3D8S537_9EURO|nr:Mediator of RNA polymerase II transcription subunit 8 [Aspergillus mulundensis]RDW81399.1 Mediator of RNA polymerase II transcription subunit 8 [Aspergillus mulundensis]